MPKVREEKNVRIVVLVAIVISCAFAFLPYLKEIESGLAIVICTVISSLIGAIFFPVKAEEY